MAKARRLALPLLTILAGWFLIATGTQVTGLLGTFLGLYMLGRAWAETS